MPCLTDKADMLLQRGTVFLLHYNVSKDLEAFLALLGLIANFSCKRPFFIFSINIEVDPAVTVILSKAKYLCSAWL